MCLRLPESLRWLISRKGDLAGALATLKRIQPGKTEAVLKSEVAEIAAASTGAESKSVGFWSGRLKIPIMLGSRKTLPPAGPRLRRVLRDSVLE